MSRRAVAGLVLGLLFSRCGRTPPAPVADVALRPLPTSAVSTPPPPPVSSASASIVAAPTEVAPPLPPAARRTFAGGGVGSASGRRGIVTSSEAQATRAGVAMLARGGNAVDAAVATAFALAVTHPSAGNLGGGGFMLVREPGAAAVTTAIDFRETAPAALTRESFDKMQSGGAKGGAAAGVPGSVAGLLLAQQRFGKLTRQDVLEPALQLASKGFVLGRRQAELLAASFAALKKDANLAQRFGKDDRPLPQGARIKLPELARVLSRIREQGSDGFYRGPTADALIR